MIDGDAPTAKRGTDGAAPKVPRSMGLARSCDVGVETVLRLGA